MLDETPQPTTADAESSGVSKPEPTPVENPISPSTSSEQENQTPVNSDEPFVVPPQDFQSTEQAPIPPIESAPAEVPPKPMEATSSPESAVPDSIKISPDKPVEVEKRGNDVTITEVMQSPSKDGYQGKQKELWGRFLDKLNFSKKKKLERIMKAVAANGRITNDGVEKMLRVSHATATRYLDILEKEGKIRQVGKRGKYTYYEQV